MSYEVRITHRAERDFAALFEEKKASSSTAALKWFRGLRKAVLSLEKMPDRCPPAPEGANLMHLLYGRKPHIYRIIFQIAAKDHRVDVLHIRHGARLPAPIAKRR